MFPTGRWLIRHPDALLGLARGASLHDLVLREDLRQMGIRLDVGEARGLAATRMHVGVVERLRRRLGESPPRTLLDIGAARGSFATAAQLAFPGLVAHSFEPLPEEFEVLSRHVESAFPFALGDTDGDATIHVSGNPGSSSLVPMSDAHVDAFPGTETVRDVNIRVRRLDSVMHEHELPLVPPVLMKIDVQGAEDRVLRGAAETLRRVDVLIVEMSLVELYEGQTLAPELRTQIEALGFRHSGTFDELRSSTGDVVQIDGLFRRA